MSALFFCAACGDNLIYISSRRLKCYKCEKYYTENFICRCQRKAGFKFSAEIIAANKVKCHFCGQEAQVPASLEPPFIDKYKGRAGSGSLGSWDGEISSFQKTTAQKSKPARPVRKSEQKAEIEKPEIDYVSEEQIIIIFPRHNSLDQIRCEIVDGVLEIQSLLVDFLEKFPLPDFSVKTKTNLINDIFTVDLLFNN